MRNPFLLLGGAVVLLSAQPVPTITPMQAPEHVAKTATVCGRVVQVGCATPASAVFLTFTPGEQQIVSVLIPAAARPAIEPRRRFVEGNVCATGRIARLTPESAPATRINYSVTLSSPEALRLVGEAQPAALFGQDAFDSCDAGVQPPRAIRQVYPAYTPEARRARLQGTVGLEGLVLPDGSVGYVRLISSLDSKLGLDDQAIKAFRSYRFTPATRDGKPVPYLQFMEFTFTIR